MVESPFSEVSLEALFERYQQADAHATSELIRRLSPDLLRFFLAQEATRMEAEDLLQNTWLRIHKARHTYRPGAPLLPWVFAIAKHVRVDAYRKLRRVQSRESATDRLPEPAAQKAPLHGETPTFEYLIASLPKSQREVLTMLKVNGLSLEEVALATSSTVGSVKQKASRAYAKLRTLLSSSGTLGSAGKEAAHTK
jgi:RNA polymerase sigma-70 factor (ECF subfamily)